MATSTSTFGNAYNHAERGQPMDPLSPRDIMTDITYEHPPLVKSQINAWTQSVNAAAVVTALFAGTATQLLGSITSAEFTPSSASTCSLRTGSAMSLLLVSSYAAMMFNALATIASFALIDHLGDIEFNGAGMSRTARQGFYRNIRNLDLLLDYGARKSFKYVFWQCE
ncbi:hypothetical protein B0H13DRAFT_2367877 [Mycena leptocephala]|nr:hypothetical protein B0H13DRAFT_2367877 [Mycena leptocephala]